MATNDLFAGTGGGVFSKPAVAADQNIIFQSVPTKIMGNPSFTLSATATSTLAVQFTTSSDKVTISNNLVTLVKPVSVSIKADQPGNYNFKPAPAVTRAFCVNPAKPVISTTTQDPALSILTSSAASGNQWYNNGVAIIGATNADFTATASGIYTVQVTVDNCASELSADKALVITGDITSYATPGLILYPNPAKNNVFIKLPGIEQGSQAEVTVYDANGKVFDRMVLGSAQPSFSVAHYATSLYIIKVAQSNKTYIGHFIKE